MPRELDHRDSNTITVESQGGIGNQLFIYAFARELNFRHEVNVRLDLWRHGLPNARTFQIGALISDDVSVIDTSTPMSRFLGPHGRQARHWSQKMAYEMGIRPKLIVERGTSFDPSLLAPPLRSRLTGYFQSWRYFTGIAEDLRRNLSSFRDELIRSTRTRSDGPCTAIHVRRGDFLHPRHMQTHPTLTSSYYAKALNSLAAYTTRPNYVIFSDDPDLALSLIRSCAPPGRVRLHESRGSDLHDLMDMSTYDQVVCANSSFSWWAAWLSGLSGRQIVAPSSWIQGLEFNLRDLLPPDWSVI